MLLQTLSTTLSLKFSHRDILPGWIVLSRSFHIGVLSMDAKLPPRGSVEREKLNKYISHLKCCINQKKIKIIKQYLGYKICWFAEHHIGHYLALQMTSPFDY